VPADLAVDAVVLATPHSLHCRQILFAAAGKHVFCEKPLALTKTEPATAIGACNDACIMLGIGQDKRFFPSRCELARFAESGSLGRFLHVEGHCSIEMAGSFSGWRLSPWGSPAGGGTGTRPTRSQQISKPLPKPPAERPVRSPQARCSVAALEAITAAVGRDGRICEAYLRRAWPVRPDRPH
jgi:Oxidoreductase family, NAD-binding Rossmann fold